MWQKALLQSHPLEPPCVVLRKWNICYTSSCVIGKQSHGFYQSTRAEEMTSKKRNSVEKKMNGIRHRRGEANRRPDFIFPPSWIHTRDTYCTNPEGETVLEYLALRPLFVLWEKLPILPRASLVSHCSGTKNAHFSSYVRLEQNYRCCCLSRRISIGDSG